MLEKIWAQPISVDFVYIDQCVDPILQCQQGRNYSVGPGSIDPDDLSLNFGTYIYELTLFTLTSMQIQGGMASHQSASAILA